MNDPSAMILRVFEHQKLKIGEKIDGITFQKNHWEQLMKFAEQTQERYFKILHDGIRFSHFVGAIQVANLSIEIIPKADRKIKADRDKWQLTLMEMLQACKLLKLEVKGSVGLRLRGGSILDLFVGVFIEEVEQLLHQGLIKSYHPIEENTYALKGSLQFSKHLNQNLTHQERFYNRYLTFDFAHPYNLIIHLALEALHRWRLSPKREEQIHKLLQWFPKLGEAPINLPRVITYDRKTARYRTAIEIAQLFLKHQSPEMRIGAHYLPAILFDMNVLFEEYVFQQLSRYANAEIIVKRQVSKPFWERRHIRPDIVVTIKNKRFVLDSKWKSLKSANPSMEDLRQMFVYNQYFQAEKSVLIYPQVGGLTDLPPIPFHETNTYNSQQFCQVLFIDVLKNGQLNHNLGKDILEKISI